VIGSSAALAYASNERGGTITHKPEADYLADGPQKPIRIWSRTGRRPLPPLSPSMQPGTALPPSACPRDGSGGGASGQSRVVSESMATVIARMSGASSPAATSTP
jgi:hypothetical protein